MSLSPPTADADDAADVARVLFAVQDALADAATDRRPVLVVGDGDGFLVGGPVVGVEERRLLADTCARIAAHPAPVLMAAPGPLLDAGLELALACDVRFVGPASPIGMPGVRAGVLPVGGGQRLVRFGGAALATRLLLLGQVVTAQDCGEVGRFAILDAAPGAAAENALAVLRSSAPLVLDSLKTVLAAAHTLPLSGGLALEADLASLLVPTADRHEGISAFRDRRDPEFRGE